MTYFGDCLIKTDLPALKPTTNSKRLRQSIEDHILFKETLSTHISSAIN